METIRVQEYGILAQDDRFNTLKLLKLLEDCKGKKDVTLIFEEGKYHFYPDYAREILMYIPNHDEDTIKQVVFDLSGFNNLTIRGSGTDFIYHTDVLPFYICDGSDITVEGITIDYHRPAYSEGTILLAEAKCMRFAIDKAQYPYEVRDGRIYFYGENYCHELYCGCLEMDAERLAPVYGGHDISFNSSQSDYSAVWTELEPGCVEARLDREDQEFLATSRVGNCMIFRHHPRNYPGFYIKDSRDVVIKDVSVYHCEAMGIIAEFTQNITLDGFRVTFSPEHSRVFTASADATHFVYCKGKIHIKNCLMENQLDDPVNIHGIYHRISRVLGSHECLLELMEHQQKGVRLGSVGDRIGVVNNETMLTEGSVRIACLKRINKDYCYLKTEEALPEVREGYVVENLEYAPDVLIEGSTFRNNRARGLLLTSAGEVVVRDNVFETAGAAILVTGDTNFWFESGAVTHICIENNIFRNCAYIPDWGKAPVQVSPGSVRYVDGKRFHKRIDIRNNRFECFDDRLLSIKNLEELSFTDNQIVHTDAYPPVPGEAFELEGVLTFEKRM